MNSANSISSARQTNISTEKLISKVISLFKSELLLSILACYFALFVCVGTIIVAASTTGELAVVW